MNWLRSGEFGAGSGEFGVLSAKLGVENANIFFSPRSPLPAYLKPFHHKNTAIAQEGKNTAVSTIPVVGTGVRLVPR
jgi:hypothetical protein